MYYKLKENYLLRGWEKLPYAVVDRTTKTANFFRGEQMSALELCNGCVDTDLPLVPQNLRDCLKELEALGIITPCSRGDRTRPEQAYHKYPARYIRAAHWSITGRCNYRCKHCYMSAPDAKYGELPHEVVMDIVRQLAECGVMTVSLTGGEALVRKDFWDIVDALLENDIRISTIYSNGKLVTDSFLDELERRSIHPEINMSYDGVGWHDWLRGVDGAEKSVEDAFLRCRERGFPAGAEMCLHRRNAHTLRDSVNRLKELGCRALKVNMVSDVGAWKENGFGAEFTSDELHQLFLDYIPQYYEDGMPMKLQLGSLFIASPGNPDQYAVVAEKHCSDPNKVCVCGHARQIMYISAEGRVLPCMALSGMDEIQKDYPTIQDMGLSACLMDSRYMRLIETKAQVLLEHNPECKACQYASKCLCGCRASALVTSPDDILAPDEEVCNVFKHGWADKVHAVMADILHKT